MGTVLHALLLFEVINFKFDSSKFFHTLFNIYISYYNGQQRGTELVHASFIIFYFDNLVRINICKSVDEVQICFKSKIAAFKTFTGPRLHLVSEIFKKVSPGLSSYALNPVEGAASLQTLIQAAEEAVPADQFNMTRLVFRATAGLRLLDQHTVDNLLHQVSVSNVKLPV